MSIGEHKSHGSMGQFRLYFKSLADRSLYCLHQQPKTVGNTQPPALHISVHRILTDLTFLHCVSLMPGQSASSSSATAAVALHTRHARLQHVREGKGKGHWVHRSTTLPN